ncbi:MAG: peptidylprolyl isomerase [Planctomycetota bacterium]|nr:peptidylprolyl isomerase [Planctomycetota bacterium]
MFLRSSASRLHLETLESRQLLAAEIVDFHGDSPAEKESVHIAALPALASSELIAEGESITAPDLVGFAKALRDSGDVRFFCAAWSEACTLQKEAFEDGGQFLPFEEVTDAARRGNALAASENITTIPTWQFGNAKNRVERIMTLEEISEASGIAIPVASIPSFVTVPDQTVMIGGALHVGIDAYDPNQDALTFTVQSSDPSILQAEVLSGNRSLTISVFGYGDMTFELFEGRVPRPTSRIIELAESDFYDGTIFHRVIDNFVMQGGDPTGTGNGGSSLGDFDDQYDLDLQHNARGILSYAKSLDDTNNSQFFITEEAFPHLDYNHSVFGAMVEGEANREAISGILAGPSGRPVFDVVLEDASVSQDSENAMLRLQPTGAGTGFVDIIVTVADPDGNEVQQTFQVEITEDAFNSSPFLDDIAPPAGTKDKPLEVQLTAQDGEGDTLVFEVERVGEPQYELTVDSETGLVTIIPPDGFSGQLQFRATVSQLEQSQSGSETDEQLIRVTIEPSSHQNQANIFDVNSDSFVAPLDALIVINHLNTFEPNSVDQLGPEHLFVDVNGDCVISPLDALLIINELNSNAAGEGEAAKAVDMFFDVWQLTEFLKPLEEDEEPSHFWQ